MITQSNLGGSFTFPNTTMTVSRMGYGAMQLAGPQVWGPPRDPQEAVRVQLINRGLTPGRARS